MPWCHITGICGKWKLAPTTDHRCTTRLFRQSQYSEVDCVWLSQQHNAACHGSHPPFASTASVILDPLPNTFEVAAGGTSCQYLAAGTSSSTTSKLKVMTTDRVMATTERDNRLLISF